MGRGRCERGRGRDELVGGLGEVNRQVAERCSTGRIGCNAGRTAENGTTGTGTRGDVQGDHHARHLQQVPVSGQQLDNDRRSGGIAGGAGDV